MQVFPRLLELGPGQFKAALHRLMMPLPSSGDPCCYVEMIIRLYCMQAHFHPAALYVPNTDAFTAVCHNTLPTVCQYLKNCFPMRTDSPTCAECAFLQLDK